jgi:hypothetical protein
VAGTAALQLRAHAHLRQGAVALVQRGQRGVRCVQQLLLGGQPVADNIPPSEQHRFPLFVAGCSSWQAMRQATRHRRK